MTYTSVFCHLNTVHSDGRLLRIEIWLHCFSSDRQQKAGADAGVRKREWSQMFKMFELILIVFSQLILIVFIRFILIVFSQLVAYT